MKIILINHYGGSLKMGMEFRPFYMGRAWAKNGHEVTILCASFAHVRKVQPKVKKDLQEEIISGIRYVYLKTPKYRGNGPGRVLNIFVFVLKLMLYSGRIARKYEPDAVIASSTYPLDNYPAKKIADKSGAQYAYEVHDLWPLSPIELGGFSRKHPFIKIMQWGEDFACANVDALISMLPATLEHFKDRGLDAAKWHYVPNGVIPGDWEAGSPAPGTHLEPIIKCRQDGYHTIGYAGSIGLANALDNLVNAAQLLRDEKYRFFIIGDGPEKERLKRMVAELGLDNIFFLDPVPKTNLPELLGHMDALYIGLQRVSLFRFGVSPNKLLDYMMAGKPVIQAIEAGNDLVLESGCGITVEPENPQELTRGIREIFRLPVEEREKMGELGRAYVTRHHDYKILAKKMIHILAQ